MVNSNRLFLICVLLALAVVVLVLTIAMMMPLKEVRPYIVEVNSTSGTVSKPIEVQKITPQLVVLQNCTNANASQP